MKKLSVLRILLLSSLVLLAACVRTVSAQPAADEWDHTERVVHVPILMYHYISTPPANGDKFVKDLAVTRDNFEAQVKWLKAQGYESITPDELIAALWHGKKLPAKPVMFTFDDGYVDAYANAFPILKEAGYTGTFFVVTDWVDIAKPGYINWDMAKAMVQAGMYVQNHSRTHEDFRRRSHEWYVDQVVKPMDDIEAHTGVRPRFFCYPYGGYDARTVWELQRVGVVAAFTENDSRYAYASNTMRLPRVRIRGAMTLEQFIGALTDNR